MSIDGCSLYGEEDAFFSPMDFSIQKSWNHHIIDIRQGCIAHLLKKQPVQEWGKINHQVLPMKGSAGGSAEAKTNSEGESSIVAEVHVSSKDEGGNKVSVTGCVEKFSEYSQGSHLTPKR